VTTGVLIAETCDGLDNDCDGTVDNGQGSDLCPPALNTATRSCVAASCIYTCSAGYYDLNANMSDGCECVDDSSASACAGATSTISLAVGGSRVLLGTIVPFGEEDWYQILFPLGARGPAGGNPRIVLTGPNASNFVLDFYRTCALTAACGTGSATGAGTFNFIDDASVVYNLNNTPWPDTIFVRVRGATAQTVCASAQYEITITR